MCQHTILMLHETFLRSTMLTLPNDKLDPNLNASFARCNRLCTREIVAKGKFLPAIERTGRTRSFAAVTQHGAADTTTTPTTVVLVCYYERITTTTRTTATTTITTTTKTTTVPSRPQPPSPSLVPGLHRGATEQKDKDETRREDLANRKAQLLHLVSHPHSIASTCYDLRTSCYRERDCSALAEGCDVELCGPAPPGCPPRSLLSQKPRPRKCDGADRSRRKSTCAEGS